MWIDRVTELQPRHKLVAVKNVSLAEEHLHDHFPAEPARGLLASPVMPASLIVEGCAQTGGILVGHAEEFKHKVILAKVNKFQIDRDATPGCNAFNTNGFLKACPGGRCDCDAGVLPFIVNHGVHRDAGAGCACAGYLLG